jgi:Tol biopolymer transport system component
MLIYRPSRGWDNVLTWFDEQGREASKVGEPGTWTDFELTLDGTQAAVFRDGSQGSELWVVDLRDGTFRRLANGIADHNSLSWSRSGDELLVAREPTPGQFHLIVLSTRDGSERILDESRIYLHPTGGWTPDGRTIVYGRGGDLWAIAADGKSPGRPLAVTPALENTPRLSPDGRWVAYVSNETGRYELYVAPFPSLAGRRQLSNTGTVTADWAEGGRALLYYEDATRTVRRIAVGERDGQPHFGAPTLAFEHLDRRNLRGADFEPQGRRLLGGLLVRKSRPPLQLVVDWPSLLERAP